MTNQSKETRPVSVFAAASFADLRAAAGEGQGEPLRLLLTDIDEDVGQPRTTFDDGALDSLAQSIAAHGVVQPVVVCAATQGRYRLVCGARRLRACRLAGLSHIPAILRPAGNDHLIVQVMENQQRADFRNSELAAAIACLAKAGMTNRQIAAVCALKDYQVAAFRQAPAFPPELASRIDHADMRALYDLFRQWCKTPAAIVAALPEPDVHLTITEARRIIAAISGKPSGSIVMAQAGSDPAVHDLTPRLDRGVTAATVFGGQETPQHTDVPSESSAHREAKRSIPDLRAASAPARRSTPTFIVAQGDGRTGKLVFDQWASRTDLALVVYSTGLEEVNLTDLRFVHVE